MQSLKKPLEDRGLRPRWNARELRGKPYSADQGSRSRKGLILSATSLKSQDWNLNSNNQGFINIERLVKHFVDPELKLRHRGSLENTDRFHSIHDNNKKVYEYISNLIDSLVEEHIGMRAYNLRLFYLCDSSIIKFIPLLTDEMFTVGSVMAVFCCS